MASSAPAAEQAVLLTSEHILATLPEGASPECVATSADWLHAVFLVSRAGEQALVLDGVEQKPYDEILRKQCWFSPDGRRLAYGARMGNRHFMVIDGVEGPAYDDVADFAFSPDSARTAYTAISVEKKIAFRWEGRLPPLTGWFIEEVERHTPVIDGVPGREYAKVWQYHFSPDSRRLAYKVEDGAWEYFIIDKVAQPAYPQVLNRHFRFSPDSRRFAYVANEGGGRRVIVDGAEQALYDNMALGGPYFSPDSKRIAYTAIRNAPGGGLRWICVADDWESREFDDVCGLSPRFSPNGSRIAWVVEDGEVRHLIVDDDAFKPSHWASDPRWSPDGKRLGFVMERGGRYLVVIDDQPGPPYDKIAMGSLHFSPDGRRTAYAAKRGETWLVVTDGTEGAEYDDVDAITFSPDGAHVAYHAKDGGRRVIVVDGLESFPYDALPGPDVTVCDGPTGLVMVWPKEPDTEGYHYEKAFGKCPIVWDGPDALHTILVRGRDVLLVRLKVRPVP